MTRLEKRIIQFVEKYRIIIFLVLISLIALYARYRFLSFKSGDYKYFLEPWFKYLKDNGGLKALKDFPGDYNAPYMAIMALLSYIPIKSIYLIKFVSIIFDFVLAVLSAKLVYKVVPKNKKWLATLTYIVVLFLPQVFLNGAFWGQCDSMYTSFCILALIFLLDKKYTKAFIALGFAFSFKLQFIFILPIFVVLYFSKKEYSIFNFLLIPLVNFILCLPAIIAGKPIIDCMMIYFKQTETYHLLQLNFINIYQLINGYYVFMKPVGILVTLVICMATLLFVLEKKVKWNTEKIITLTLWFLVIVTFTLPCMHDRYLFLGEILSIIYYIIYRKNALLVLIININAILTYSTYLFSKSSVNFQVMAIIYLVLILIFSKNTFKLLIEEE